MTVPVRRSCIITIISALGACAISGTTASAEPFALASPNPYPSSVFSPVLRDDPRDSAATQSDHALAPRLQRQVVDYPTREAPGTVVIDTPNTYLYFVLGNGKALRYGIGVGREGFTWAGIESISRMAEWPDWIPPSEMIARQPYLPRFVAGGPGNPLGARALYLGNSAYRIHGTNDPSTIGHNVSSGCIRMTNENVMDLYARVRLGAKVVVLPQSGRTASTYQVPTRAAPSFQTSARTAPPVMPVSARTVAPAPRAQASTTGAGFDTGFAFGIH